MRRLGLEFLVVAAVIGAASVVTAADGRGAGPTPSLEYRPPRPVIPEPKAPTPLPPKTVFAETIGSFGIMSGSFDRPVDVVRDRDGNFYVLDAGNNRVQKFSRTGNFVTSWGSNGNRESQFNSPSAIAIGQWGPESEVVYVVDTGNHRVQYFSKTGVFLGQWGSLGSARGNFKSPRDITVDDRGRVYVLDSGNERVQRFGSGGGLGSSTFELRNGNFADMTSIVVSREHAGPLYVLGTGCLVQEFSTAAVDDGYLQNSFSAIAPDSGLCVPARIRIDEKNDYLYILDVGNSLLICYNPSVGGMYRWALRGAEVPFFKPLGLAVNADGDEILVADTENNSVQKFTLR